MSECVHDLGSRVYFEPTASYLKIIQEHVLEEIRRIRNVGRQWMTENSNEITAEQQVEWWSSMSQMPKKDFRFFIFVIDGGPILGYGMLSRRQNNILHISLAVAPEEQGKGHGTYIYDTVASKADEPVNAVILKNNIASIKAAEKAGFRFVEEGDKTVLYVRSK